jgi:choline dehydrogenase-like flavoprotein
MYKVTGIRTLNEDYYNPFAKLVMGINYALFRRGPLTMPPSQLCAFTRSAPEYATPNIQFHLQPLSLEAWGEGLHRWPGITASVTNVRPTSVGSVHLAGGDMARDVRIDPNYLATDEDRRVAVQSLKKVREIVSQPALAPYRPEEHRPGAAARTDDALLKAAEEMGTTIFHPVGSAKMGADGDRMAVCDERLRVRGLDGLRVIDASIMPRITSGNTNAPSIMIGEKGAGMVLEDARG